MSEGAETVLVVDDEPSIVEMFRTWLEPTYDVRTVTDGPTALETVDDDVDLVLLDRRMPRRNGDEVLAGLREQGHDVPVVMVSAVPPDVDVIDAPLDSYLVKPVDREALQRAVAAGLLTASLSAETREYYANAVKRSMLEATKLRGELRTSDAYRSLVDDLEAAELSGSKRTGRMTQDLTGDVYRDIES
ncbi:response regulator [Haloparvum sp. PAK95]|uniref:response regulator n=1 Tax=Haloparvum sp. PAK95 TaxID=3418962 RepID=UPI003D2ECD9A